MNRRAHRTDQHQLSVLYTDTGMRVECTCGGDVTGRREVDRLKLTLSDLLEMVRLHSVSLDDPKRYGG